MLHKVKQLLSTIKFTSILFLTKPKYEAKIFCIGYNKTGTTTLGKALEILGFRNSSFNLKVWRNLYKKGNIEAVIKYTAKFDSFDDLPWLLEDMIPILDVRFPNSKFIYLEREEEAWKKSFNNWYYKYHGYYPDINASFKRYQEHRNFVMNYFATRKKDLLILNVSDPNAFSILGDFVNKKAPSNNLPHFNKA